jgi:hypothetical protein
MRQRRTQDQRMQELQADRTQSARQEMSRDEEGARVENRQNRDMQNTQGPRDKLKVIQVNLGRGWRRRNKRMWSSSKSRTVTCRHESDGPSTEGVAPTR